MKKRRFLISLLAVLSAALPLCGFFAVRGICFPRPYTEVVEACGTEPSLVYAVMKAESGFCEDARSGAGAVGLMQLRPSTALFVCTQEGIAFEAEMLTEGSYNVRLGCLYLNYLLARFTVWETAAAAYNAGEGRVSLWLKDGALSDDGVTLKKIPYGETAAYVKKIAKFRKFYEFLYR